MKKSICKLTAKRMALLSLLVLSLACVLKNEKASGQEVAYGEPQQMYGYYWALSHGSWGDVIRLVPCTTFGVCSGSTTIALNDYIHFGNYEPMTYGVWEDISFTRNVKIKTLTPPVNGTVTYTDVSSTSESQSFVLTVYTSGASICLSGFPNITYQCASSAFAGTDPFTLQLVDATTEEAIDNPVTYTAYVESSSPVFSASLNTLCPGQTIDISNQDASGNTYWGGETGPLDLSCAWCGNSPYNMGTISSSNTSIATVWGPYAHGIYQPFYVTGGSTAGSTSVTINWTNACGSGSQSLSFTTLEAPSVSYPSESCVGSISPTSGPSPSGGSFGLDGGWWGTTPSIDPGTGVITATYGGEGYYYYTGPNGCSTTNYLKIDGLNPSPSSALEMCTGTSQEAAWPYGTWGVGISGSWWSSSDNTVATVDGYGNVYAVGPGSATIAFTALSTDAGCSLSPDFVSQTINVNPIPGSITLSNSIIIVGSTTPVVATESDGSAGSWSIDGPFSIDGSGNIYAFSPGWGNVTFTNFGGCSTSTGLNASAVGFVNGNNQTINGCENTLSGFDGLLSVFDLSTSSTLIWNITNPPTHGTVAGDGYFTASTGSTVSPSGFTYTPGPGYSGIDNFTITVSDGAGNTDYTNITVNVNSLGSITITSTGPSVSPSAICIGQNASATPTTTGGSWSTTSGGSVVTIDPVSGSLTGVANGADAVLYTLDGCTISNSISVNSPDNISVASTNINITPDPSGGPTTLPGSTFVSDATIGGTWSATGTIFPSTGNVALTVNPTTGTATAIWPGTYAISYTTSNGCSATAPITVGLTTSGFIVDPPSQTWMVNSSSVHVSDTLNVCENTTNYSFNNYLAVFDTSNTATLTWSISTPSSHGTASGSYSATSDNNTLEPSNFAYTPNPYYSGIDSFVTKISDGTNNIYITFFVNINPISQVIVSNFCTPGSTTAIDSTAGGTWSELNGNSSIDASGVVTGSAAGWDSIIYTMPTGCRASSFIRLDAPTVQPIYSYVSYPWGTGAAVTYNCTNDNSFLACATPDGIWSCSDSTKITFETDPYLWGGGGSSAYIKCNSTGDEIIYYTVSNTCGTHVQTFGLSIYQSPDSIYVSNVCVGSTVTATTDSSAGIWWTLYGKASVDVGGNVTGVSKGTDILVFSLTDDYCYSYKQIEIDGIPSLVTWPDGESALCSGPSNNIYLVDSLSGGIWSTSDATVARIGNIGTYIDASGSEYSQVAITGGYTTGTAIISYSLTNFCGTFIDTALVTVIQGPSAINVTNLCFPGDTITATDSISGGTWGGTFAWSGYYPPVVEISSSGLVTAYNSGNDFINYTLPDGCSVTAYLSVGDTIGAISGSHYVCTGYFGLYLNENPMSTAGGIWSSSDTSIASVTVMDELWSNTAEVHGIRPGSVTITYTRSSNCMSAEYVTYPVTVQAPTTGEVITGASTITTGATVSLSDSISGGTWSVADTTIARIEMDGVITGIASGSTVVSYRYFDACSWNTATKSITVTTATYTASITGLNSVCVSSTITLSDSTTGGTWSSSNTAIATVGASSGIVSGAGSGSATITYTHSGIYVIKAITVNPLPNAGTITGTAYVCAGSNTSLSDAVSGGTWSSSSSNATVSAGLVHGATAGNATVSYSVSNSCGTAVSTDIITINPLPNAGSITGTAYMCAGSNTTLSDGASGGTWSSSNSNASVVAGVVTGVTSGKDTISYTVANTCGTAVATDVVTINPMPNAGSITGTAYVCAGSNTTLSDAVSGGTWSSSSSNATVSGGLVHGSTTGNATISYSMTNTCGTAVATALVTINPIPSAGSITGAAYMCAGSATTLSDAASGGAWTASNSNATVSSGVVHGFAAGKDTISYTVSNSCGTAVATDVVTVNPMPNAGTITGTAYVCAGSNTTLTDVASGGMWSSSSAYATVSGGLVHGVAAGSATISYSVTNSCGTAVATDVVTINGLPAVAALSGTAYVCTGTNTTLTDATTGGIWSSSNSNATVSGGVVTGVTAGTATISYSVTNGCGSTSVTKIVTINTIGSIGGGSSVCAGNMTTLTDTSAGGTWSSSNAAIVSVSSSTGIITGSATTGSATISYAKGGCFVTQAVTNNTNPLGSITVPALCVGATGTATGSPTGGAWSSSSAALATIDATYGAITGVAAGTPYITYSQSGCYRVAAAAISSVYPVAISGPTSVCVGNVATLSDATAGGSWSSSNTAVASISASTGVISGGATTGTATITYNKAGCYVTRSFTNNANYIGALTVPAVCVGNTVSATDTTSGGIWSSSNTTLATIDPTYGVITGVAAGTPYITYTASGCYKLAALTVGNVTPAAISGTSGVCSGDVTTLTDSTTGGSWSSSNTSIASVSASTGIVTGGASTGTATITYNKAGCYATMSFSNSANPIGNLTVPAVCTGNTVTATDTSTGGTWSSSNTALATIDPALGVIAGVAAGTPVITYSKLGCYKTAVTTVTSTYPVAITGATSVCAGNVATVTDATTGGSWSSSNAVIAAISASSGVINGGTSTGTVTITYNKSGCYVTQSFTNMANPIGNVTAPAVCVANTVTATDTTAGGTWSSSNIALATIDPSLGVVTGVASGTPTITYSKSGCYKISAVTVGSVTPSAITGTTTICTGSNTTSLTEATTGGTWTSSAPTIAGVSSTGVVTGLSVGTTNISYTKAGCFVSVPVTVSANLIGALTGTTAVCLGYATTLSDTTAGGTWSSSNTALATVSSGLVSGVSAGLVTITYTGGSGCYKTANVTVNSIYPGGITGATSVCAGANTITLADTTTGGTWSSTNTAVATVGSTGVVTGVSSGSVVISYTKLGCAATKSLTISSNPIGAVTGVVPVCVGNTVTATDTSVGGAWSSSNTALATIDPALGVITGVAAGTPVITYSKSGCYKIAVTTVTSTYPVAIAGATSVCAGNVATVTDATTGGSWSSSNAGVASISASSGVINGGTSTGTVTITYNKSGCYVTQSFTNMANPIGNVTAPAVCVANTVTATDTTAGGTWSSSNIALATIDPSLGVVTGVASGTPTITYSKSGCYKISAVTVGSVTPSAITGTTTVCTGSNTTSLTEATTGGTWTSSAPTIAGVSSTGVVTGLSVGTTNISYTKAGCFVSVPVTVSANLVGSVTGTTAVCLGYATTLSDTTAGGTWSSSNTSLATVSSGLVNGVSAGLVTITYTGGSGCYKTANVTVSGAYPGSVIGANTVCSGNTTTLSDTTAGGTWATSNPTIATVTSTGVVSGIATGSVNISYTKLGCSTAQSFTVSSNPIAPITGTAIVCTGNQTTLTDTYAGGTWSSSNTVLATVSGGLVNGLTAGAVTITYASGAGCYRTAVVSVSSVNPSVISGPTSVCAGNMVTLTDSSAGGSWSSSNTSIAAVSATTGVVTGGSATGTAVITYNKAGCYKTQTFTNNANPVGNITAPPVCVGLTVTATDTTSGGTWSSSNSALATIDPTYGVVTGVAAGSPVISYSKSGCYKIASATVTATNPAAISGATSVCVGNVATLTDASTGGTWSSSNTSIAAINASSGVVTGGTTTGTATITYNKAGCYVTASFNNNANTMNVINGASAVCSGNTITLSDSTYYANWTSSNTSVATIGALAGNTASLSGVAAGSAVITYTGASTGCYKTLNITVGSPFSTAITGTASLCAGNYTTLSDATTGGSWSSSNTTVAPIYAATGVVIAGSTSGTATITYTKAGCFVTQVVTVNANPVANITGTTSACLGVNTTLSDASGGGSWSIYNTNATLSSSGVYNGVTAGTDIVTYTGSTGCYKMATITLKALPAAITGTALLCAGSSSSLSSATAGGAWSSGASSVASINSSGVVTGVGTGYANITYSAGGCTTTAVVTVNIEALPPIIGDTSLLSYGTTSLFTYDTMSVAALGGTWSSSNTTVASVVSSDSIYHATGAYPFLSFVPYAARAVLQIPLTAGSSVISYTLSNGCYTTSSLTVAAPTFTTYVLIVKGGGGTGGGTGDSSSVKAGGGLTGGTISGGRGTSGGSGDSSATGNNSNNYNSLEISDILNDFEFYPNPNNGILHIQYQYNAILHAKARLYNTMGECVYFGDLNFENGISNLNLSQYKDGLYLFEIAINDKESRRRTLIIRK